jgi:hypothetical protein
VIAPKYNRFSLDIYFMCSGEYGIDMGALAREWMSEVGRTAATQMFEQVKLFGFGSKFPNCFFFSHFKCWNGLQVKVREMLYYQPHIRYCTDALWSDFNEVTFECLGRIFAKSFFEVMFVGETGELRIAFRRKSKTC